MTTSTRFLHHNQLVNENIIKKNFNAIVPNVYISSISYCIKMNKTSLLSNVAEPVHAKDFVRRAQFEPFEVQCYEVNVICCEDVDHEIDLHMV